MVGFRLGHMMSLQVQQVTAPTPPATTWAVIGEDKGAGSGFGKLYLSVQAGRKAAQLEKLDLLQLGTGAPISSFNASNR